MDNGLFRRRSMDRISSPEELHDYMRVTSPRLWMILSAVIVLLAGFIIYASTARLENTVNVRVRVDTLEASGDASGDVPSGRTVICSGSAPLSMKDAIETGMQVRIGEERGKITLIMVGDEEPGKDDAVGFLVSLENPIPALPDGEYDAELVLESATPVSFLWN